MGKSYEGILPHGNDLHNSRKLKKRVAIYKTGKQILSKTSLSLKTEGSEKSTLLKM